MRITIPTTGSLGDVHPFVALGRGLQAHGHHVRIATHADFGPLVRRHGLDFHAIESNGRQLQASVTGTRMVQAGERPLAFLREFCRLRQPLVAGLMARALEACADSDLLFISPTALLITLSVAERLGLPTCWTALQPAAPTRSFASFLFPELPSWLPGRGLYNVMTHLASGEIAFQYMRDAVNRARRDVLDLPPYPLLGPVGQTLGGQRLYGYSRLLAPKPPDWGERQHVTGYWFLDEPGYRPAPELQAFLCAGPPPVYIGFGSNHEPDPGMMTRLVLRAVELAGVRALLAVGWGAMEAVSGSPHVLSIGSVPHDWLFPQTAGVVHHGGAGTTGAAIRAGVPNVAVTYFGDQPFWGSRAHALGVGPCPIPRRRLTAARLAKALRALVADPGLRERAALLGAALRAEDGVGQAVAVFQRLVAAPLEARAASGRAVGWLRRAGQLAVQRPA